MNKNLKNAKRNKNDEFYTKISDIENELKYYKKHFENKTVYCNCDDPNFSNFYTYFKINFYHLKLKRLIVSYYVEDINKKAFYTEIISQNNELIETKKELKDNGDFRSEECMKLLEQSDIVCTNPPFSLFREYVDLIVEHKKQFLILGNMNAVTYKNVFNHIKNGLLWLGYSVNKTMEFRLSNSYEKYNSIDEFGNKFGKVPSISWFTNLTHNKRNEELFLSKEYNANIYQKYDNYDAINVDKVVDIPKDFYGYIGVPITFLEKFNKNQFEILGIMNTGEENIDIRKPNTKHGRPIINGVEKYLRIIIKRKLI